LLADLRNHRRIASNILAAYLGSKTGPKVLAGQIRRGTGEEITAILWSSDLRGFTERSDRLEGVQVITMSTRCSTHRLRQSSVTAAKFSNLWVMGYCPFFQSILPIKHLLPRVAR